MKRREFIVGSLVIPFISIPKAEANVLRMPFLEVGDDVSFLYFEDWQRPFQPQTTSCRVEHVGNWNGTSYDIILSIWDYYRKTVYWDGIDSEWCMFRKEVPEFNWALVDVNTYPNIHSYVREKRFGESPNLMKLKMEENMTISPPPVHIRGQVETRENLFKL